MGKYQRSYRVPRTYWSGQDFMPNIFFNVPNRMTGVGLRYRWVINQISGGDPPLVALPLNWYFIPAGEHCG